MFIYSDQLIYDIFDSDGFRRESYVRISRDRFSLFDKKKIKIDSGIVLGLGFVFSDIDTRNSLVGE